MCYTSPTMAQEANEPPDGDGGVTSWGILHGADDIMLVQHANGKE